MAQCELNPRSISSKSPSFALLITLLLWDSYAFAAIFRRIERKTSYDDHVILLFSIFIFYIFIFHSNNSDTQICICMNDQLETILFFFTAEKLNYDKCFLRVHFKYKTISSLCPMLEDLFLYSYEAEFIQ